MLRNDPIVALVTVTFATTAVADARQYCTRRSKGQISDVQIPGPERACPTAEIGARIQRPGGRECVEAVASSRLEVPDDVDPSGAV